MQDTAIHRWRPAAGIRFKALGLHWRGAAMLAAAVPDDDGRIKGMRPLGGSVNFGETAQAAVIREFREELGIDVQTTGAADDVNRIAFHEGNGTLCHASWVDPHTLDLPGGPALYPDGLRGIIKRKQQAGGPMSGRPPVTGF
ncbi:NUDIX domain-containing protein [Loktanella sp. DSM 29012]|uniref:NUDIX domain-containing protein n=1 Tax=Loktanella sp. DSM 29012 TaxID=1881056 RepID=UPI0008BAE78A|nr:NUDIX domain-containing protein [Loktanella sp. DSM 29012]SEQ19670.1 NUDIX domain-containing protein [Loktanella sp. DSM 29012]